MLVILCKTVTRLYRLTKSFSLISESSRANELASFASEDINSHKSQYEPSKKTERDQKTKTSTCVAELTHPKVLDWMCKKKCLNFFFTFLCIARFKNSSWQQASQNWHVNGLVNLDHWRSLTEREKQILGYILQIKEETTDEMLKCRFNLQLYRNKGHSSGSEVNMVNLVLYLKLTPPW